MFDKKTSIAFEDYKIDVEVESEHGFITLCLTQLIYNESDDIYKEGKIIEVHPDPEELKEVVKILQETIETSNQSE